MERGELFGMSKGAKFSDKKPHLPKVRPGVPVHFSGVPVHFCYCPFWSGL